jgi:hypothetical protein
MRNPQKKMKNSTKKEVSLHLSTGIHILTFKFSIRLTKALEIHRATCRSTKTKKSQFLFLFIFSLILYFLSNDMHTCKKQKNVNVLLLFHKSASSDVKYQTHCQVNESIYFLSLFYFQWRWLHMKFNMNI